MRSAAIHAAASIAMCRDDYLWSYTIEKLDEPIEKTVHKRLRWRVWGIWRNIDVDGLVDDRVTAG
jgi:hypothetical protein